MHDEVCAHTRTNSGNPRPPHHITNGRPGCELYYVRKKDSRVAKKLAKAQGQDDTSARYYYQQTERASLYAITSIHTNIHTPVVRGACFIWQSACDVGSITTTPTRIYGKR